MNPKNLFSNGLVFLFLFSLGRPVHAADYIGAQELLRRAMPAAGQRGKTNAPRDANAIFHDNLAKFQSQLTNLSPADAAQGWLDLAYLAHTNLHGDRMAMMRRGQPGQSGQLFGALPPPAAWDDLAKLIESRIGTNQNPPQFEIGLRMLANALARNPKDHQKEIEALQLRERGAGEGEKYQLRNLMQQLSQAVFEASDDTNAILKTLEYQLAKNSSQFWASLDIPDLVSEFGPEKAEAFLRKALVQPKGQLTFSGQNATTRLAQKLALEMIDQLKVPHWELVNSLDGLDLYEALDKRFGQTNGAPAMVPGMPIPDADEGGDLGDAHSEAKFYYLLALISKDRSKEAVTFASKINDNGRVVFPPQAIKGMQEAGYGAALDNFFFELLSQDPTLPFWNPYVTLAAQMGTTQRMLDLAKSAAAKPNLTDSKKAAISQALFRALLAADNVDEAVEQIRRAVGSKNEGAAYGNLNKAGAGLEMVRLGYLLHRNEWVDEGLVMIHRVPSDNATPDDTDEFAGFGNTQVYGPVCEILFKLNRGPEAESLCLEALAKFDSSKATTKQRSYGNNAAMVLGTLLKLYHNAGRQQDVLTLLEESPDWGSRDVSDLFGQGLQMFGFNDLNFIHHAVDPAPMPYLVADALLAAGRKEEAGKITTELLHRDAGCDRGYELLLAIKGSNAVPELDELYSRDQFEERPLIWKAHLLREENQLADAEKVVRQAIAVDPSDGEEGPGDRMRAYSELADIREALGDQKDAQFYREVVKSIRMSEDADQYYQAGLLKRAIPMYQEALTHFSDAYCIQSRLAIQMSQMGMTKEAEEHYRRAYELMPDSFGRVESHCFGCERAFEGERAQGIAEKVFTKLVVERPDKPQVHYLLGYLRDEQERYHDSLTNYQAAVRLDPDYLNAWVKLNGLGEHVVLKRETRDDVVFNLLRLDPLQRHIMPNFRKVTDLRKLWSSVAAVARVQQPLATNIFALKASQAEIEKKKKKQDFESDSSNGTSSSYGYSEMNESRYDLSPAKAVQQTAFVSVASQLILDNFGFDE